MGCDIHLYAERRADDYARWEYVIPTERGQQLPIYEGGAYSYLRPWGVDRDYDLFGMLAGVRHGEEVEVIASPRGWPGDTCPELEGQSAGDGIDHTPSWLTVDEVIDFIERKGPDQPERARASLVEFQGTLLAILAAADAAPSQVRLVFYFDS